MLSIVDKSLITSRAALVLFLCLLMSMIVSGMFHFSHFLNIQYYSDLLLILKNNLLTNNFGPDSWGPMIEAIKWLRENPNALIYQHVFFEQHIKFQYPVSSLLLFDIPNRLGMDWTTLTNWINRLSWVSSIATSIIIYHIFINAFGISKLHQQLDHRTKGLWLGMSFLMVALFYPIQFSIYIGQIQTLMTFFVALTLLTFQLKKLTTSGVLIGICCAIKPHWLVLIVWALLRRQWRMAFSALFTVAIFYSLAIHFYGIENFIDYRSVISYLSQHGESYSHNHSANGLINRLLMQGNNLEWLPNDFPPFHPVVFWTTMLSSIVLLSIALFWRIKHSPSAVDLSIAFLCVTMASPIAWEHHYGVVAPIFAVLIPVLFASNSRPNVLANALLILITFVCMSQNLSVVTDWVWNTHWNFLQSYVYLSAIIVLTLLMRVNRDSTS